MRDIASQTKFVWGNSEKEPPNRLCKTSCNVIATPIPTFPSRRNVSKPDKYFPIISKKFKYIYHSIKSTDD